MPSQHFAFWVILCLGVVLAAGAARCHVATPLGSEFPVNAHTPGNQRFPEVGMDADGDFVVVWWSNGQDGSGYGVFARRFDAAGQSLGGEFQVNISNQQGQRNARIGMDVDGDFVVVWASQGQDGANYGIFARRFAATGAGLGSEFQVNTYTGGSEFSPAFAMENNGDFVVAWHGNGHDASGNGIFARRFNAAGVGLANEFQVNVLTANSQEDPAVGMDGDGDFVIAWESYLQDGSARGIFARRFNGAGAAVGGEFQVNSYTPGNQQSPAVAVEGDGDFAVAWESVGQDGSGFGVFARRFDAAGERIGAELQVSTYTTSDQSDAAIGVFGNDQLIVAWASAGQDGSLDGVFARRLAADAVVDPEFRVNTFVTNSQGAPGLGTRGGSDLVVAWDSDAQDGSARGVFAQRFEKRAVLDIDGNGSTGALTDGLLVLRFLFGFTGATLVAGAVDVAGCTRCSASAIETYIGALI
jgi:hypothetical protein